MRKGNLRLGIGLLLTCWMSFAIAASDGLILGFEASHEVRLVSLVAAHLPLRVGASAGPHWTLRATDGADREIWIRSFVVPRQYDGAGMTELSFSVVVPRPAAGTQLSMRDNASIEIWHGSIDDAMLQVAVDAGALIQKELAQAARKRATGNPKANASLALKTEQAEVRVSALKSAKHAMPHEAVSNFDLMSERRGRPGSIAPGSATTLAPSNHPMPRILPALGSAASSINNTLSKLSVPAKLTAEDSWELDVRLLDPSGQQISTVPSGYAFSYDDYSTHFPLEASPGRLRALVPQQPNTIYRIYLSDMPGYTPRIFLRVGTITGNTSVSFTLKSAAQARVRLNVEGGLPLPDGGRVVQCYSAGNDPLVSYVDFQNVDDGAATTLPLPDDESLDCNVIIDESRLQVTFNDVVFHSPVLRILTLPATSDVTIRLLEAAGNEFSGPFGIAWFGSNAYSLCAANPCRLLLPLGLPAELGVGFYDGSYRNFSIGPEIFPPGTVRTITLKHEFAVSGMANVDGLPYESTRVRAFDSASGALILSTIAEWNTGRFQLPLVEGTYVFEAERNAEYLYEDSTFYRSPWRSNPIHISGDTELPPLTDAQSVGHLSLIAQVPCHGTGSYRPDFSARVVVTAADGTRIEHVVNADTTTGTEPCTSRYMATLSPGVYDVEFSPIGWPARTLHDVSIAANTTAVRTESFGADSRTLVWTGTLRTASGQVVAGAAVNLFDEALDNRISTWTDSQGGFEIPFAPTWIAQIETGGFQVGTDSVRKIIHFSDAPPSSNPTLDETPTISELQNGLIRLFGDGQIENRFNLVFVAEGYVENHETFTDSNGNGAWDGIVWYDLDGDGVLSAGDIYQVYGTASYPEGGTVPTANNEPFTDNNDDGFPNLDDHALFIENVHAFLKSLFGSDFWDRHRNAFNAYALFEPSEQAGYSVISPEGARIFTRNTRYGAALDLNRDILRINIQAMITRVLAAMPDADVAVAMVNQPIFGGRANAGPNFLIYNGGPATVSNDSAAPAHEMGHVVAGLCDEYSEFVEINPYRDQTNLSCANASYSANPAQIPWANWLTRGDKIPSSNLDGSIGVYEGASYYVGGAYRPSFRSMMNELSPLFNAPSRSALETAVHARTRGWHDAADDSGRCARLPPRAIRRPGVTCH